MKRKISFGITLLLMLSLLLLALTACGDKECEHSYSSAVTKASTCESDGVMTYTCSLCTDSYTEAIPALGHDEIPHEAKAPTCTEKGWDAYVTCSRCDYTTYVEKAALTHDEVSHDAKAPTCTESELDSQFEKEIREFKTKRLPQIYLLLDKYSGEKSVTVLRSREEADEYVESIKITRLQI